MRSRNKSPSPAALSPSPAFSPLALHLTHRRLFTIHASDHAWALSLYVTPLFFLHGELWLRERWALVAFQPPRDLARSCKLIVSRERASPYFRDIKTQGTDEASSDIPRIRLALPGRGTGEQNSRWRRRGIHACARRPLWRVPIRCRARGGPAVRKSGNVDNETTVEGSKMRER